MFDDFPREFWPAMRYVLWRYDPSDALAVGYHWLNLCEAVAWFVIAAVVARRMFKHRRAPVWESLYVTLFVVFGLSDVYEAYAVPLWLIAAKGFIFMGIVAVRAVLVKRHYPGAKF